jgi:hypothetical protein
MQAVLPHSPTCAFCIHHLQVWRRPRRWRKRPQAWEQEVTFAVLPDPEAIKEARRRRRPPPAPSIDQISWSADDQRWVPACFLARASGTCGAFDHQVCCAEQGWLAHQPDPTDYLLRCP